MNEIQIFNNPRFGQIRTAGTAGNPLFCLGDVCEALGLTTSKVAQRLSKDVLSKHPLPTSGGEQQANFVNEDGLYDVILDSRKPEAKQFRKWVTSEVLPAIRKTGGYLNAKGLSDDELMAKALEVAHRTLQQKELALHEKEMENIELAAENQELRHDRSYLDLIMRSKELVTISQIAQDYGMSGRAMNNQLASMGIQYSVNGQWLLYAKYKDCGYVSSRTIEFTRTDGRKDFKLHTEWTQAGRKFLYEALKKLDIIPMLER